MLKTMPSPGREGGGDLLSVDEPVGAGHAPLDEPRRAAVHPFAHRQVALGACSGARRSAGRRSDASPAG